MKLKYQRPRGTQDLLPNFMEKWNYVETIWRSLVSTFGYREIVTPMFEHTDLFVHSAGETSDIVTKEMYTFADRKGRSLTLRPEGTSSVVRAYLENEMNRWPQPVKLFYLVPMFRYETPQAGRFRQHTQYGVEAIGSPDPFTDAEVIKLVITFYEKLKIQGIKLELNSVGDAKCRPLYLEKLLVYLRTIYDNLCKDCQNRVEHNPLRVLDCKEEKCQSYLREAPKMLDYLSEESRLHFEKLCEYLQEFHISYTINPRLVRGLDYYTRTAFEVVSEHLGAQNALAGGGRYDGLVEVLGGDPTPAVGFGAGMERLITVLEERKIPFPEHDHLDIFIIRIGQEADKICRDLLWRLRGHGIIADIDHLEGAKMKLQLAKAVKMEAKYALILGEDEIAQKTISLRNLTTREQYSIPLDSVVDKVKEMVSPGKSF
jgi:histidyl-tRNA synthetase